MGNNRSETRIPDGALVLVNSGVKQFKSTVDKSEWDFDQWSYFIYGEWYCQSEVTEL